MKVGVATEIQNFFFSFFTTKYIRQARNQGGLHQARLVAAMAEGVLALAIASALHEAASAVATPRGDGRLVGRGDCPHASSS